VSASTGTASYTAATLKRAYSHSASIASGSVSAPTATYASQIGASHSASIGSPPIPGGGAPIGGAPAGGVRPEGAAIGGAPAAGSSSVRRKYWRNLINLFTVRTPKIASLWLKRGKSLANMSAWPQWNHTCA
jgi:hypothetical protein